MKSLTKLPLKDSFETWMIEEGVTPASADSYCSYVSGACKNLRVKYRGQIMYVFNAIQLFIDKKDAEIMYDFMVKINHLFYNENYLKMLDRPQSTICNWRTGINRYQEFILQYLEFEVEEDNINIGNIVLENEDTVAENIIEITKEELYNNFYFRLITQDRYYKNIIYPIGLIKRLFFKTDRRNTFNKHVYTMINNTVIYTENGRIYLANVKSLFIDRKKEEVYLLTNEDKKFQVFTPTCENKNTPFKVKSLTQISLDHIVPMHDIMVQNKEELNEILKLTKAIRERIKGKVDYKKMRGTYSLIINDADNLEEFINFSTLENELALLLEKTKLQLMDRSQNTKKGKK